MTMSHVGIDQLKNEIMTSLYHDPEWVSSLSDLEQTFLDMIQNRRYLGYDFYVTANYDRIILVDTSDRVGGTRYEFPSDQYYISYVGEGKLELVDTLNGKKRKLVFDNGKLNLFGVKYFDGLTTKGRNNIYPAFVVKTNFGYGSGKIRLSHLVVGMVEGPIAIMLMRGKIHGHHKDKNPNRNTKSSIELLFPEEHMKLHAEERRKKKVNQDGGDS